jgi:RNA polymerase sigma-70 factor, ECF subfamily
MRSPPLARRHRTSDPATRERLLLDTARAGDEAAFRLLVEPHRGRLHGHCRRMLGSSHDADDALQETLLRAWRGLGGFDGRGALRSWLYTIATGVCLDALKRRTRLSAAAADAAAVRRAAPRGVSLAARGPEPVDLDQVPDDGTPASPHSRYEQREGVEQAFVAAIQHLAPNQRAALILKDAFGFSSREVATRLDTTTASVNSALQRARKVVRERLPEQDDQATLRALDDERMNAAVGRYVSAMERNDVGEVVTLLSEDVSWAAAEPAPCAEPCPC